MPNPTAPRAPDDQAASSDRALALRERLDSAVAEDLSANISRFLRFLGHADGDVIELQVYWSSESADRIWLDVCWFAVGEGRSILTTVLLDDPVAGAFGTRTTARPSAMACQWDRTHTTAVHVFVSAVPALQTDTRSGSAVELDDRQMAPVLEARHAQLESRKVGVRRR